MILSQIVSGTQIAALSVLAAGLGATLLLSLVRPFRRIALLDRLRPYHPGAHVTGPSSLDAGSFRAVIAPIARRYGAVLARAVGVREDLAVRLRRVHSPLDPTAFRTRQLGWSWMGFMVAALVVASLAIPPIVGLAMVLGLAIAAALVPEQQLAAENERYRRGLFGELPIVAEQLAMLLGAGYSLGAALGRLADRGSGLAARDLRDVLNRVHLGLPIDVALREWADRADIDELHRLVHVLALHRAATDLGPLISEEARSMRREAHRRLITQMEHRAQMVWIPVTVAALLPGAIFLAVPFADALRLVAA